MKTHKTKYFINRHCKVSVLLYFLDSGFQIKGKTFFFNFIVGFQEDVFYLKQTQSALYPGGSKAFYNNELT